MMRAIIGTFVATVAVALLCGGVVVYAGLINVAATDPHSPPIFWLMETARVRSIKAHAAGIPVPPGLGDQAKILMGTEHYAAHCTVCHGAPGVPKGDIAAGLYPAPPSLTEAANEFSSAELFWIVKHGIKMTGMPTWNDHSDDELWATVAFLEKLPGMTEQEYAKLIVASMTMGAHHHPGGSTEPAAGSPDRDHSPQTPPAPAPAGATDAPHQHR